MKDYLKHRQRLRNRFVRNGFDGLADYEVAELLLTLVIPRCDVKPVAKDLIKHFGNIRNILDADAADLAKFKGIGPVTPVALRVIRETANLYLQQKAEAGDSLSDPTVLHEFWRARIGSLPNEVFEVAYLDSAYRLMRNGVATLTEGTPDRSTVYTRRVIEAALLRKASVLVFAHNHPNGNLQPSEQDKTITRALVLAATTVNIKVLDHLIVGPNAVFSFRKEGLL